VARFDSDAGTRLTLDALLDLQALVPEWADEALCIGQWDLFDADTGGSGRISNATKAKWAKAVAICNTCPVMDKCLFDAIRDEIPMLQRFKDGSGVHTIRGGMLPQERVAFINSRVVL
jgi:hypothetical protein